MLLLRKHGRVDDHGNRYDNRQEQGQSRQGRCQIVLTTTADTRDHPPGECEQGNAQSDEHHDSNSSTPSRSVVPIISAIIFARTTRTRAFFEKTSVELGTLSSPVAAGQGEADQHDATGQASQIHNSQNNRTHFCSRSRTVSNLLGRRPG